MNDTWLYLTLSTAGVVVAAGLGLAVRRLLDHATPRRPQPRARR